MGHAGSALGVRPVETGSDTMRADTDKKKTDGSNNGATLTHELGSEEAAWCNAEEGCSYPMIESMDRSDNAEAAPLVAGMLFDEDGLVDSKHASEAVCMPGWNTKKHMASAIKSIALAGIV